ncbi:MAG: RsmE family RNA methyltransferase [Candidatus Doudnabacteria bacterium]|nr:RsmE family RNA methyltransferase [Candidatus Doudnabacteria bacterium]
MSYFFCAENLSVGQVAGLSGEEARHILLSRRTKPGEQINLQDPRRQRFAAEVMVSDKKSVKVKVLKVLPVPDESPVFLTLFLAVVSEAALDFVLQKGTELGLGRLILFNSENTGTRLSADNFKKKLPRWEKIVKEAAKQSDRAVWPQIEFFPSIREVGHKLAEYDKIILFDITGRGFSRPEGYRNIKSLALIIGPEGGLTGGEIALFRSPSRAETVSLGPILLRADTASLSALSTVRLLTK